MLTRSIKMAQRSMMSFFKAKAPASNSSPCKITADMSPTKNGIQKNRKVDSPIKSPYGHKIPLRKTAAKKPSSKLGKNLSPPKKVAANQSPLKEINPDVDISNKKDSKDLAENKIKIQKTSKLSNADIKRHTDTKSEDIDKNPSKLDLNLPGEVKRIPEVDENNLTEEKDSEIIATVDNTATIINNKSSNLTGKSDDGKDCVERDTNTRDGDVGLKGNGNQEDIEMDLKGDCDASYMEFDKKLNRSGADANRNKNSIDNKNMGNRDAEDIEPKRCDTILKGSVSKKRKRVYLSEEEEEVQSKELKKLDSEIKDDKKLDDEMDSSNKDKNLMNKKQTFNKRKREVDKRGNERNTLNGDRGKKGSVGSTLNGDKGKKSEEVDDIAKVEEMLSPQENKKSIHSFFAKSGPKKKKVPTATLR